jgi:hypothetical protein
MSEIQIYKPSVSLATKKANIQQQAASLCNDIDLKNLDALEAFMDKFIDLCNSKAKLVCKYTPEELRNDLIKKNWLSYKILCKRDPVTRELFPIDTKYLIGIYTGSTAYIDGKEMKKDTIYPNLQYFIDNFKLIVNNMSQKINNNGNMYKDTYLHKTTFNKYELIDFENLHILTDVNLKEFLTSDENNIEDLKKIATQLFADSLEIKAINNDKKYMMLKTIYSGSAFNKLQEMNERVASLENGKPVFKCEWLENMYYPVFLKLYKRLYKSFNLNDMESGVEQATQEMLYFRENLRSMINAL